MLAVGEREVNPSNEGSMSDTEKEIDWAEKIGSSCYSCLRDMVAALECDYDRLAELREVRGHGVGLLVGKVENPTASWNAENPDDAEELAELEAAAGDCSDQDDAETRIHEDPLSVEVRSDWTTPGEEMTPGEFQILLSTGGPATRIMGELDEHGEPYRAWLEVQDWFKPWTEYHIADGMETLLAYARCFTYGQ